MEGLIQNQALIFRMLEVVAFLICLLVVVIFVFYNWLYLSRILKSKDHIGLRPPQHIAHLVKTCIYIPVFTAMFIVFFIILGLY